MVDAHTPATPRRQSGPNGSQGKQNPRFLSSHAQYSQTCRADLTGIYVVGRKANTTNLDGWRRVETIPCERAGLSPNRMRDIGRTNREPGIHSRGRGLNCFALRPAVVARADVRRGIPAGARGVSTLTQDY